jgi:hypothetical protein
MVALGEHSQERLVASTAANSLPRSKIDAGTTAILLVGAPLPKPWGLDGLSTLVLSYS